VIRPRIYFERGWWRVRKIGKPWKRLTAEERENLLETHRQLNTLNWKTFAVDLRNRHYANRDSARKAKQRIVTEQEQATRGRT